MVEQEGILCVTFPLSGIENTCCVLFHLSAQTMSKVHGAKCTLAVFIATPSMHFFCHYGLRTCSFGVQLSTQNCHCAQRCTKRRQHLSTSCAASQEVLNSLCEEITLDSSLPTLKTKQMVQLQFCSVCNFKTYLGVLNQVLYLFIFVIRSHYYLWMNFI